ncbi:hypothetical protein ACQEU8_28440 [Streptomyces sp. CA-250714]|uniref:hypothetical protein n=1 Tax=Streptomyces sp. CA-250714 TaxID=3240060 RepID=UPI003D929019
MKSFARGERLSEVRVLLVCSAVLLASCSHAPEREYRVPQSLCGLKVAEKRYAPLFGPGEKIYRDDDPVKLGSARVTSQGCHYFVDGKPAVSVSGEWAEENDQAAPSTPAEAIKWHNTRDKPRKYEGAYDVATWQRGAVAAIDCPRPRGDDDASFTRYLVDIFATDTPLNDDPERAHKVFGKLAQEVMEKVAKKLPCRVSQVK